jgi:hypothetical protein
VTYLHPSMRPKKGIRKSRSKPRPGRLKGKALEQLRRDCFERDCYRCGCGQRVEWDGPWWCKGQMAHLVSRGRGGKDELSNVVTKCYDCHMVKEHSYGPSGVKPCPKKEIYEAN